MLSDALRRWNPWWAEKRVRQELIAIERDKLADIRKSLKLQQIKDIIGVRRCGKTFLLYQTIQNLISSGIDAKNITMLNFDDNEIYDADFDEILLECKKINPKISHILLDEVQEKKGWERWVRTLYDTREFAQIFVSGSSSSLLKSDIGRVLTGRHNTFILFPFSFAEYLRFNGWNNFEMNFLEHHKAEIMHFLEKYIKNGGFPETLKMNTFNRNNYLNHIFDDVLSKDIVARHGANYEIIKKIAYYLTSHSSKTMSHRSIASACNISTDTVSKYISFIEESFLSFSLKKFSSKLKEQMREINKYYCIDTGMVNAVGYKLSDEFTRLMENCVFLELNRRHMEDRRIEIFYWQDVQQKEVDFVIKKGMKISELMQVCYDIKLSETRKREISSLMRAMEEFKLKKATIITWNHDANEKHDGKKIIFIPLWKWLLSANVVN
ncbi:MAG: ATP-binding protein [Candidatus Aenigmatarchaeota archaeon]